MKKQTNLGFTLIELMIVVAIIGVLAVLAIFGVSKYLRNAKTAEATNTIGAINQDAVQAYNKERTTPQIVVGALAAGANNQLCVASSAVPSSGPPANQKYTASPAADYATDPGWNCLQFTMNQPQYFQYKYDLGATSSIAGDATFGGDGTGWAVGALADFNADATSEIEFASGGNIANNTPVTATAIASWDKKAGAAL